MEPNLYPPEYAADDDLNLERDRVERASKICIGKMYEAGHLEHASAARYLRRVVKTYTPEKYYKHEAERHHIKATDLHATVLAYFDRPFDRGLLRPLMPTDGDA